MAIADAVDDGKLPASVQTSVQNQCGHSEHTRLKYYNPKRRTRDADISSNAFDAATGWREKYGVPSSPSRQQHRRSLAMDSAGENDNDSDGSSGG